MGTIRKKLKTASGFTLAETLLAVLILLMVSVIVATGIPAAKNAYEKVVLASNADALLSTTISSLRNELGAAKISTPVENNYVSYYSGAASYDAASGHYVTSGTRSVICRNNSLNNDYKFGTDPDKCIMLQRYAPLGGINYSPEMQAQMKAVRLVSKAASNQNLYVTYDYVTYANGILTFTGLKVCRDSDNNAHHPLTKPIKLCIRVLSY
jgi:type II secretory pathway pseudopilin PulG